MPGAAQDDGCRGGDVIRERSAWRRKAVGLRFDHAREICGRRFAPPRYWVHGKTASAIGSSARRAGGSDPCRLSGPASLPMVVDLRLREVAAIAVGTGAASHGCRSRRETLFFELAVSWRNMLPLMAVVFVGRPRIAGPTEVAAPDRRLRFLGRGLVGGWVSGAAVFLRGHFLGPPFLLEGRFLGCRP